MQFDIYYSSAGSRIMQERINLDYFLLAFVFQYCSA